MKKILSALAFFFAISAALQSQIVISEIMYNPPEAGTDSLEYIELHNSSNAVVDLEGWSLFGVTLVFPAGTTLPAGGYLLTAGRASAMQNVFGKTAVQWAGGALTNSGETLKVLNKDGATIDEVTYDDALPWPTDAAGNGMSLELCNVAADNSLAENWKAATKNTGAVIGGKQVFATPGDANTTSCLPSADRTVSVQNFFFAPADITINQGESIIWVCSEGTHNVNGSKATFPANPEGFSSGAPVAAPWFFLDTFDVPGIYSYRSDMFVSQGMVGKITVLAAAPPKIVISEIMYNDPGPDSLEYIELTNIGTEAADISGWTFSQGVTYTFPAGTSMAAGEKLVLTRFADYFDSFFGFKPTHLFTGALTNSGEDLELRNTQNEVMDYVDYLPTAPWPVGANGGGKALVLCSLTADNNLPLNWSDASTATGKSINGIELFANPGAANGCPTTFVLADDNVSVIPGTSVNINVLANDFLPNPGNTTVSIQSPPSHGAVLVNADKTIKYTPGTGYCGKDELTYKTTDGAITATAKVNINVKCYPKLNIQDVVGIDGNGSADSIGVSCEIEAVVYGTNLNPAGHRFTIIDPTNNGLHIFRNTGSVGYTVKEGDRVAVRGTIDQYFGLTELVADTIIKKSENNALVNPLTVVRLTEGTESKLVKINNLKLVNPAEWTTGQGASGFTARAVAPANPNDTIQIRIDNDADLFNEPAPLVSFNLIGIGGQFDVAPPYSSGYQVFPRYKPDLQLISATDEADFSQNVRLAPNPTADFVRIRTDKAFDQIQISNSMGQVLRSIEEPDLEEIVDLQSFGKGVFYVRFVLDGQFWATRIIKI